MSRTVQSVVLAVMSMITTMLPCSVAAAPLEAATAKVDITPPLGLTMYGFASRKTGATGVLDPLMARVLVLAAGDTRLALVVLDLGEPPASGWIDRLRADAAANNKIAHVIVAATHTHSGPDIRAAYPPAASPDWESAALSKIEHALAEASGRVVQARIGTGYGTVLIGHNRLREEPNGTITWFERNNTMVPTSPVDPTVAVLRLDRLDGTPMAVLVNYACHPVVFGPDNLQYSADYPGVMARVVEQEMGSDTVAMFLQGGDGDINPFYAVHPVNEDAVGRRDWTGERLGREAARVARAIKTEAAPDASLDYAEDVMDFDLRWNPDKYRPERRQPWGAAKEPRSGNQSRPSVVRAPVDTLLIDKRIALVTLPGEPFVDYQIDWRNRCPVHDAFFLGYADDSGSRPRRVRRRQQRHLRSARRRRPHRGSRNRENLRDAGTPA
jgi:neutral ceramidase